MKIILTESKLRDLVQNYIKDHIDVIESSKGLYDLSIIKKDGRRVFEISNDDGVVGVADWFYLKLIAYFGSSDLLIRQSILEVLGEIFGRNFQSIYVMSSHF